jgi:hypothetical protein
MHGCDAGGRLKLRYDLYQTSTSSTHHPHLQSVLTCIQPLPPSRTRGPHLARESHLYFHSLHPPTRYLTFLSFDPQLNLRHQSPTCSSESFNFDKHHSFARIPFAPRTSPCQHPIPLHSTLSILLHLRALSLPPTLARARASSTFHSQLITALWLVLQSLRHDRRPYGTYHRP